MAALKALLLSAVMSTATALVAQVVPLIQLCDMGELIPAKAPHYCDFHLYNTGADTCTVFRVEHPSELEVRLSSKLLAPGDTLRVRVAINPTGPGPFSYDLPLYLSHWKEAGTLRIRGMSTYTAAAPLPCPDFGAEESPDVRFTLSAVSVPSGQVVPGVSYTLYREGERIASVTGDEHRTAQLSLPYGYYLVSARAGKARTDTALYVNATTSYLSLSLDISAEQIGEGEPVATVPPEINRLDTTKSTKTAPASTGQELSRDLFRQNNLVFLVDVSTSMKQQQRLQLLKVAMIDLLEVLRPEDKFALISYSDDTSILIEPVQSLNKDECRKAIAQLEAAGGTSGAHALSRAGKLAARQLIDQGYNAVIIATDGGFSDGTDRAVKIASNLRQKGVFTSVLGIRCNNFNTRKMSEVAEAGAGTFIPINAPEDAGTLLINAIKAATLMPAK